MMQLHFLTLCLTNIDRIYPALGVGVLSILVSPSIYAQNTNQNMAVATGNDASAIPITTLDTTVVTATRSQKTLSNTPIPVTVIDSQMLTKHHAHTLKDAIALLPNVNLRQIHGKTGYEVVMQGMGGDQVLVLIDGLPITASTGSTVNLNQYLNTEVAQIEVIQGASSAQYGSSAMGGVINVITKKLQPNQPITGHVNVELATNGKQNPSQNDFDNNVSHFETSIDTNLNAAGNWLGRISASYHDDKGLTVNPSDWTRIKDASEQQQISGKLVYRTNPDSTKRQVWLEATQYQEDDVSRFTYYVAPKLLPQQREENIDKTRYTAGFNYQFAKNTSDTPSLTNLFFGGNLQGSMLFEDYQSDSNTFVFNNDAKESTEKRQTDIKTHLAQLQYDLPNWGVKNGTHLLQVGAQWQQDKLSQTKNGMTELTSNDVSREGIEGYVQDDWLIGDNWELLTGIRYQHDSDFGSHTAPKLAVKYSQYDDKGREHTWRASVGQGYRVPNLKERYYVFDHSNLGYKVLGNLDLKPETSISYQLGYQTQLRKNLNLAINAYYNDIEDLIQTDDVNATYDGNIAIYHYMNVEDATTYGGDMSSSWQATPNDLISASYAYTHTKNNQTGTELVGKPEHTAMLTWDKKINEKLQWINQLRYESKHLVSTASRAYSPDWMTVNTKLNYQMNPNLSLYAGVNNVFDEQKDSKDANDQRPVDSRQWLAGATLHF